MIALTPDELLARAVEAHARGFALLHYGRAYVFTTRVAVAVRELTGRASWTHDAAVAPARRAAPRVDLRCAVDEDDGVLFAWRSGGLRLRETVHDAIARRWSPATLVALPWDERLFDARNVNFEHDDEYTVTRRDDGRIILRSRGKRGASPLTRTLRAVTSCEVRA